ncbi:hypothetical protein F5146DRAFT_53328 [Armillaria mellea]|nr:hypothetical protein F5146DRAFT_53328 [Armillaria mellea]
MEATSTSPIVGDAPSSEPTPSDIPSSPTSLVSGTASNASPNPASQTNIIVGIVLGVLALGCAVSTSIFVLFRQRRSKAATPLPLPQNSPAPSFLTPYPSSMSVRQERETETQEPTSEVPRDQLEAEMARMREEIMTLRLGNQIRRTEAGYSSLPPPSYWSLQRFALSRSFDM